MKTHITGKELDITPSLHTYIERKLATIERIIKKFDAEGATELWVEVARTTRHHQKGLVFKAEMNLHLPGALLRASEQGEDIRVAIDKAKNTIRLEIEKYKTKHIRRPRRSSKTEA